MQRNMGSTVQRQQKMSFFLMMGGVKMGIIPVVLLLVGLFTPCNAASGSHSLRYFHIGASDPAPGSPEFYTVGYVNEIPYDWYDIQSEAEGMSKVNTEDLQYWEQNTQIYRGWQQGFNGDQSAAI